jgi:hypothetical protein
MPPRNAKKQQVRLGIHNLCSKSKSETTIATGFAIDSASSGLRLVGVRVSVKEKQSTEVSEPG